MKGANIPILYEDNHLIAVNKPAGWLVQADKTGDTTLADYVKLYIKKRYKKEGDVFLGIIHRIDRPVSGLVVFARTSKGLKRMNKLFQDRMIEKTYWAICNKRPEPIEGRLKHFLLKDHDKNVTKAYDQRSNRSKNAKESMLDYKLIGGIGSLNLIEVKPSTGRPHQIRTQLAKIDCSIRGDVKYGAEKPNKDGSIHLHARKLNFIHPVKQIPIEIIANSPNEQIWNQFKHLDL